MVVKLLAVSAALLFMNACGEESLESGLQSHHSLALQGIESEYYGKTLKNQWYVYGSETSGVSDHVMITQCFTDNTFRNCHKAAGQADFTSCDVFRAGSGYEFVKCDG